MADIIYLDKDQNPTSLSKAVMVKVDGVVSSPAYEFGGPGSGPHPGSGHKDKTEQIKQKDFPARHKELEGQGFKHQGWNVKGSGVTASMVHSYKNDNGDKKKVEVSDYGDKRGQALVKSQTMMQGIRSKFPDF